MMKACSGIEYDRCSDVGPLRNWRTYRYENTHFKECVFRNPCISAPSTPSRRSIIRNVVIEDCRIINGAVEGAVFDEVVIRNLATPNDPLFVRAAAFRHVTLEGHIGKLSLHSGLMPRQHKSPEQIRAFHQANLEFYQDVDWAFDLTQASFVEWDLRGWIPLHLIRINPDTQVKVSRERLLDGKWLTLPELQNVHYHVSLQWLAEDEGNPGTVLALPARSRRKAEFERALQVLLDYRIAEL